MRTRMLLLAALTVALGFGVLAMHSTVLPTMAHAAPAHAAMQPHDSSSVPAHDSLAPAMPHAMSHPCVFILAAAVGLAVVMLVWAVAGAFDDRLRRLPRVGRHALGRAPPWTAPTLSRLSVLRL